MINYVAAPLNVVEYNHLLFFFTFSHHFDWDKDNTYSWHGARGQMEHEMLGQSGISLGQNETEIQGKLAYFNKLMRE